MKLDDWEMTRAVAEGDHAGVLAIFARHTPELFRIPLSEWDFRSQTGLVSPCLFAGHIFLRATKHRGIVKSIHTRLYSPAIYLPTSTSPSF